MHQTRQNHAVNVLLPLALLLAFAVTALAVLLFATRIYRDITQNSAKNDVSRTALSYVSEKIHHFDSAGTIYLDEIEGCDVLVMEQDHGGSRYYTYIYLKESNLTELFVREGAVASLSSGRRIVEVQDFAMAAVGGDLFRFTCTDSTGETATALVNVRSQREVTP